MITQDELIERLCDYIEAEWLPLYSIDKQGLILLGTVVARLGKGGLAKWIKNKLQHPVIEAFGIVNEDGDFNIDLLYQALKHEKLKGKFLPFSYQTGDRWFGLITFKDKDADILYAYLKGEK